ncbi:MAG: hypothetical protein ABL864_08850 [Terricaulis sp.]|jgi:long-subunit acyl-CoA synthetase (AMP-forming)
MSSIVTSSARRSAQDHFEPEAQLDPQEQRRMRGHLEQIDYAAFAANRETVSKVLGRTDLSRFEHLAVSAAQARANWVAAAIAITETGRTPNPEQIAHLATLRQTFEELTEAYNALRRMVERGYLPYQPRV